MSFSLSISPSREKPIVLAILASGALARLAWIITGGRIKPVINESHNVAVALARSGNFADTFFPGQGPTAHVGMLTPLPSALVYWLFGPDTYMAEYALVLWSIALVTAGFWLCWRLARQLDVPVWARLTAVALAALMPLQFSLEVREGRSWEVDLAVALLLWILLRLARADQEPDQSAAIFAVTGAVGGLLFIISPPAGIAAVLAGALFLFLRRPPPRAWAAPLAFVLAAGLLAGFWTERNLRALGQPVPLRDNLGLELDLSNYQGALDPADPRAEYLKRLNDIHPLGTGPGRAAIHRAGGEIAYYQSRDREAESWIAAHKLDFLRLSVRRFVEFYLPPRWFWFTFGAEGKIVPLRQVIAWATAVAGLATLLVMAWRRRVYAYFLAAALACALPYVAIQPILRYRYLVSSLLILSACDGIARLIIYLRNRSGHDISIQAPGA